MSILSEDVETEVDCLDIQVEEAAVTVEGISPRNYFLVSIKYSRF